MQIDINVECEFSSHTKAWTMLNVHRLSSCLFRLLNESLEKKKHFLLWCLSSEQHVVSVLDFVFAFDFNGQQNANNELLDCLLRGKSHISVNIYL